MNLVLRKCSIKTICKSLFVAFSVLLILVTPIRWDNQQLILFGTLPLLYWMYQYYFKNDFQPRISKVDFLWIGFALWGMLSFIWAIDGSLIWNHLFGWIGLIIWMIFTRSITMNKELLRRTSLVLVVVFLVSLIYWLFVYFTQDLSIRPNWNRHFGYNRNHTSVYMVSMLSFLLFYPGNQKMLICLKVLSTLAISYILYISTSRGSVIVFIVLLLYYLYTFKFKKLLIGYSVLLTFTAILLLAFNVVLKEDSMSSIIAFGVDEDVSRLYMIESSLKLFAEHPVTGIGLGNWHLEAYKYGVDKITMGSNYPNIVKRETNHNLYSQILAELGIIGIALILILLYHVIYKGLKKSWQFSAFEKSCFSVVLIYWCSVLFFQSPTITHSYFGKPQFLAFCCMGIVSKGIHIQQYALLKKVVIMLLSLLVSIWFLYNFFSCFIFIRAENQNNADLDAHIAILEDVYNPLFNTTYKNDRSISLLIANKYWSKKDYVNADKYFQESLRNEPFGEDVHLQYAKYLTREKGAFEEAMGHAKFVENIQSNLYENNLLIAEIAINTGKYDLAREYLNKFDYTVQFEWQTRIIDHMLSLRSLLSGVIELSDTQLKLWDDIHFEWEKNLDVYKSYLSKIDGIEDLSNPSDIIVLRKTIDRNLEQIEFDFFGKILSLKEYEQFLAHKNRRQTKNQFSKLNRLLELLPEQDRIVRRAVEKKIVNRQITRFLKLNDFRMTNDKAKYSIQKIDSTFSSKVMSCLSEEQKKSFLSELQVK